jgi:hypothetical protein
MASSSSFFHSYARRSQAIGLGLGITLALAALVVVAPGGCTLNTQGLSAGSGGASTSSTSTTTTTTATTSTSTGGCAVDADCGAPMFDGCTVSTCVDSVCTPKSTAGMMSATQTPNDCNVSVCGPDGKPTLTPDPNDKPVDDLNPCTQELCVNGLPTKMPAVEGTVCPGGTCDGAGACFNCTKDTDCTAPNATCDMTTHSCVSCSDGIQNGKETGLDCGGNCKNCGGDTCNNKGDCVSNHCAKGICCDTDCNGGCTACDLAGSPGICTNVPAGHQDPGNCDSATQACNGGGMCKKAAGEPCGMDDECGSNVCFAGLCRIETGGICGTDGLTCASGLCTGMKCLDCSASNQCTSMVCGAPTCKAPGGAACEMDSDCAGNKCQFGLCLVDNGSMCSVYSDCRSGVCALGLCVPCGNGFPCSAGATCGATAFGPVGTCNRPKGGYCSSNPQCQAAAPSCTGFPKTCQ